MIGTSYFLVFLILEFGRKTDPDFVTLLMLPRFLELGTTLEPGKPVKSDKAAILSDATRMVIQLRAEAKQLKDTNESLEDKIKELKVMQPNLHPYSNLLLSKSLWLECFLTIFSLRLIHFILAKMGNWEHILSDLEYNLVGMLRAIYHLA